MAIDENILQEELAVLKNDFDKTRKQIETVDKQVLIMKNNLNALNGAIQQTEKLIKMSKENKENFYSNLLNKLKEEKEISLSSEEKANEKI